MKLYSIASLLAALTLATVGCAKDPSKEAPAAKVEEAKPQPVAVEPAAEPSPVAAPVEASPVVAPEAATPAAGPALTFPGIALAGTVQAVGSKVTGSHVLNFKMWKGGFEAKDGKAEGGKLELEVQVGSLEEVVKERNEWIDKFEGHMKSPDFFDVAQFATASFQALEIKAGGDAAVKGTTHTIKGNLTLRGVTKEVTFPATVAIAGKEVTAKAEFSINRSDFGIKYPGKPDDLIREGVVLKIDVKGTLP